MSPQPPPVEQDEPTRPTSQRYRVGRVLGRGGMGVVFEAYDLARGELVALKTLRALEGDALFLFKREFRALADVRHPNLVSLGELVFEGGAWFFTMELLSGSDLRTYVRGTGPVDGWSSTGTPTVVDTPAQLDVGALDGADAPAPSVPPSSLPPPSSAGRGAPFDEERLRRALAGLAQGLHAVHDAGKAHLDIKPSNVRVTEQGRTVLLDFGLAGAAAVHAARPGHVLGTPTYMAPEQLRGVVGPEADLYAVGVLLYEALSGRPPHEGDTREIVDAKLRGRMLPLALLAPRAPADLVELATQLLSLEPAARPRARDVAARARGGAAALGSSSRGAAPVSRGAPARADASPAFVGRARELATLAAAFDGRVAGRPTIVSIEGEAGLGKSALAATFAADVAARADARVLVGRCYENECVPYKAFDALVDDLAMLLAADPERASQLAPHVTAAARLFPVLGPGDGSADAPTGDDVETRRRGFAGLSAILASLAQERPLILLLDDVQWGDDDSARLAEELLDPAHAPSLLLVATERASLPGDAPGPLSSALRLAREATVVRLVLGPLEQEDTARLAGLLGSTDMAATASLGNPLLLRELARHAGGDAAADVSTIMASVRSRVALLPDAAQRVLEAVAIAGRPTSEAVLFRAAGVARDDGERDHVVETLARAGLVKRGGARSPDALEAAHDRVREAVVGTLPDDRRRRLHAALAAALAEQPSPEPDALAPHLASAGDATGAARWARVAAESCERALAFGRAARFHELVLADPTLSPADRRAVLARLGAALASAGRGRAAADTFLAAAVGASAAEALSFKQRASEQLLVSGYMKEGKRVLYDVLREVGIAVPPGLLATLPLFLYERARLLARGLDFRLRDERDVPEQARVRADACLAAARALSIVDTMQGAYFQLRQLRLALDAGEPVRIMNGLALSSGFHAAEDGTRGDRADRWLLAAERAAPGVPNPRGPAYLDMARGVIAYCRGDWEGTVHWSRETSTWLETRCHDVTWDLNVSRVFWSLGLGLSGDLCGLERVLPGWLKDARSRGDLYVSSHLRMMASPWLHLARGDVRAGHAELDGAFREWSADGFSWAAYFGHFHRALLALYEGRAAAAGEALAHHAAWPYPLYLANCVVQRVLTGWARGAVHAATLGAPRRPSRAHDVAREAAKIRKADEPWAMGLATLLDAACAMQTSPSLAAAKLRQGERELAAARLGLFADAAAYAAARLDTTAQRQALLDGAATRLRARGVVDVDRLTDTLVPGVTL